MDPLITDADNAMIQMYLPSILELIQNRLHNEKDSTDVVVDVHDESLCQHVVSYPPSFSLDLALHRIESIPSAQQLVFILHFQKQQQPSSSLLSSSSFSEEEEGLKRPFHNALYTGNDRIVVRIWKNACQWMYLTSNKNVLKKYPLTNNKKEEDDDDKTNNFSSILKEDQQQQEQQEQQQQQLQQIQDKESILHLAKAEVTGYRIAQRIFSYKNKNKTIYSSIIIQPHVLFFSKDDDNESIPSSSSSSSSLLPYPWALFSYVGEHSIYYTSNFYYCHPYHQPSIIIHNNNNNNCITTRQDYHHTHCILTHQSSHSFIPTTTTTTTRTTATMTRWIYHSSFIHNMVRNRLEYGFHETHPRHGRVCVDQCLDYALHVLNTILLPLHCTFFHYLNDYKSDTEKKDIMLFWSTKELLYLGGIIIIHDDDESLEEEEEEEEVTSNNNNQNNNDNYNNNQKNHHRHADRRKKRKTSIISIKPIRYGDLVSTYEFVLNTLKEDMISVVELSILFYKLETWIQILQQEKESLMKHGQYDSIPGVLCHLDLQPQNMIFHQQEEEELQHQQYDETSSKIHSMDLDNHNHNNNIPIISSVLDWEECCYADPRFELLLLCRKVVSNYDQANIVWNMYTNKIEELYGTTFRVGSIIPWLRLESVHSIMTMIRHLCYGSSSSSSSRNNVYHHSSGRIPWENQTELYAKIERELERLSSWGEA